METNHNLQDDMEIITITDNHNYDEDFDFDFDYDPNEMYYALQEPTE